MGRPMRFRGTVTTFAMLAIAGLVAVACTSSAGSEGSGVAAVPTSRATDPPGTPVPAEPAGSAWIEPTKVMGAPNLVNEPDPELTRHAFKSAR